MKCCVVQVVLDLTGPALAMPYNRPKQKSKDGEKRRICKQRFYAGSSVEIPTNAIPAA
jgi:hypothetical protein